MGKIVHFEGFSSRQCRYFLDRDGLPSCRCTHPENEDWEILTVRPGPLTVKIAACHIFNCPLGVCLHPETDPEDVELMKANDFDPEGCSDETWMLLTGEPMAPTPGETLTPI